MKVNLFRVASLQFTLFFLVFLVVELLDDKGWLDDDVQAKTRLGRARWHQLCASSEPVIYKTVAGVAGIQLLKVRSDRTSREFNDIMWSGAAMPLELGGDGYIRSFLLPELSRETLNGDPVPIMPGGKRGYLGVLTLGRSLGLYDRPGYRYVDVVDSGTGTLARYALNGQWELQQQEPLTPPSRYGVTFEDVVDVSDRALGVASTVIKVIDLDTDEVLAIQQVHAFASGFLSGEWQVRGNEPWLRGAAQCPGKVSTRMFVDSVLYPLGR